MEAFKLLIRQDAIAYVRGEIGAEDFKRRLKSRFNDVNEVSKLAEWVMEKTIP